MTTALARLIRSRSLTLVPALALLSILTFGRHAEAQLARLGGGAGVVHSPVMGNDIAYDWKTGRYLTVGGYGAILGNCTDSVATAFVIMDGVGRTGHYPRVEYSPDLPNGAGGTGAFLVTWHHSVGIPNSVYSRVITCHPSAPSPFAGPENLVSDGTPTWWLAGPAIAYSVTSQRFLVVWENGFFSIQGRVLDVNGTPIGGVQTYAANSRDPSVAWNPASNEFGVGYSGFGAYAAFFRARATDGVPVSATATFGGSPGTYNTDMAVNLVTNNYLMVWESYTGANYILFNSAGAQLATGLMTTAFGGNDNLAVDYNPVSGTFLTVGQHNSAYEIGGAELNSSGFPVTSAQVLTAGGGLPGSFFPRTVGQKDAPYWGLSYSLKYTDAVKQLVFTSSTNGGPAGPAPAPPTPAPTPAPSTGGCAGSDPFASLGGGHCENGGWRMGPASSPTPTPAPAPAPTPPPPTTSNSGCVGSDPFVSLGGGHCENGGWRMGPATNSTPTPAPPPTPTPAPSGGCSTSDPFVSIGGGVCVNGGWQPQNMSCSTPDPFVSIGGGICSNGGWRPRGLPVPEPEFQQEPRW